MKPIEFDITKQLDTFSKLSNQMPFIISKAINDIAFNEARQDAASEFQGTFEQRDKSFASKNAFKVGRSTKQNLKVTIYHFKEQLGLQQFGGVETPQGSKIAVPIRSNLSRYAGVAQNKKIPKNLTITTMMSKAPRKRGEPLYKTSGVKPFILKRGVYIRTPDGLRQLYTFLDSAKHTKKLFKLQRAIERTYSIHLESYIDRQYRALLNK